MRIIVFLLLFSFIVRPALSQVPTKQEMQSQMLEAIEEFNTQIAGLEKQIDEAKKHKEDAESIQQMEDELAMLKKQVAMMGGVNRGISKISEKTFEQAAQKDDNTGAPKKDVARIKMLPDKILTEAELVSFVKIVHLEVEKLLNTEDKTETQKIYSAAIAEKKSPNDINNIASNLWLSGYTEMALFLLGKTCTADMSNANNLNNYAAFLTMAGGEHAALPILQNINRRFPGNSTILNNVGQAWYGLGDLNNANRYLDSTVNIYRNHSQANQTKSKIQESEGRTKESIESIKRSIQENYTTEKEARLNELGGKLEYRDIPFPYPGKAEPLGIEQFMFSIPAYPLEGGVGAQISRNEWDQFRESIKAAQEPIKSKIEELKAKQEIYAQQLLANPQLLKPYNNPIYKTAGRKLTLLTESATDRTVALADKFYEAGDSTNKWRDEYKEASIGLIDCGARKGLATSFLSKANLLWKQRNTEQLTFQKQLLNAAARLSLYAYTDQSSYLLAIENIKLNFLTYLASQHVEFEVGCLQTEAPVGQRKLLPDFDEMNCDYKDEIFIPPFTTIKTECNKMSTEFNIDTETGVKVKVGWEENLNTGKLTKGTLEVGYEASLDHNLGIGPIKTELKGQVAAGIEITQDGIQEVYIKGSAGAEGVGYMDENYIENVLIPSNEQLATKGSSLTGAEVKVSWNAGANGNPGSLNSSASASGLCNSINIGGK